MTDITIRINGVKIRFDEGQSPMQSGDVIRVPLRSTFYALGFDVTWDGGNRRITAENPRFKFIFHIDSDLYTIHDKANDREIHPQHLGVPLSINENGVTMMPIKSPVEAIGGNLEWDRHTNTVLISTNNIGSIKMIVDVDNLEWRGGSESPDLTEGGLIGHLAVGTILNTINPVQTYNDSSRTWIKVLHDASGIIGWVEIRSKDTNTENIIIHPTPRTGGVVASGAVPRAAGEGTENWNDPRFNIELVPISNGVGSGHSYLRRAHSVTIGNTTFNANVRPHHRNTISKIVVHNDGSWHVSSRNVTASEFRKNTMMRSGRATGYHFVVDVFGEMAQYALIEDRITHTGGIYNNEGIGVAYINKRFSAEEKCLTDSARMQVAPTSKQYDSLVWLVSMLAVEFNIDVNSENILTHSRGGSQASRDPSCPIFFSANFNHNAEENWQQFLLDVAATANVIRN